MVRSAYSIMSGVRSDASSARRRSAYTLSRCVHSGGKGANNGTRGEVVKSPVTTICATSACAAPPRPGCSAVPMLPALSPTHLCVEHLVVVKQLLADVVEVRLHLW